MGVRISSSIPSISLEGARVKVRLSLLSPSTTTTYEKPAFDVEYRVSLIYERYNYHNEFLPPEVFIVLLCSWLNLV